MPVEAGIGDAAARQRAREARAGLACSLVGLEWRAVDDVFAEFPAGGPASRERIAFVGLVVDHLTAQRVMERGPSDGNPLTDVAPQGPEPVYDDARTMRLFAVNDDLNRSAVAQVEGFRGAAG